MQGAIKSSKILFLNVKLILLLNFEFCFSGEGFKGFDLMFSILV